MLNSKNLHARGYIKNLKMLTQSQITQSKFNATLDDIQPFLNSLKALSFDETATFQITENGLRVVVENSKLMQGIVYIGKDFFKEYHSPKDKVFNFAVSLNVINECLGIFAGFECDLKLVYKGEATPLILIFEQKGEGNVVTECSIKTKDHEEPLDYFFDEKSPSFNLAYIRGPDLADLLSEIDKTSEEIEIFLSPDYPFFRISTVGVMQSESKIEVSNTSDMMIFFSCKKTSTWRYKQSHIKMAMKALPLASKVAVRTDSTGILGLQLMVLSQEAEQIHIDFYITPLVNCD